MKAKRGKEKLKHKVKITENDVKRAVKDYLNINGWFSFPLTAGIGSYRGAPDRIAIKNNRVLFLEIKRPGGRQSIHQQRFQKNIEEHGGEYYVVKSLDDLIKIID